jgi:hypothetical protein
MTEVVLSTDQLTVLGGPSSINVEVDMGATGPRGSYTYIGYGHPNTTTSLDDKDIQVYDLYIDVDPSSDSYKTMFHYIDLVSGWQSVVRLSPNTYNFNKVIGSSTSSAPLKWVDGSATISLAMVSIVPPEIANNTSIDKFNIQYSINNSDTDSVISSTFSVGELTGTPTSLPITIKAIEYVDSSWRPIDSTVIVNLFINVV